MLTVFYSINVGVIYLVPTLNSLFDYQATDYFLIIIIAVIRPLYYNIITCRVNEGSIAYILGFRCSVRKWFIMDSGFGFVVQQHRP
jgi:hypothetical protein